MISEISFSRNYSAFWSEYTPWTKNFLSSINSRLHQQIYDPMEQKEKPEHRSINNTVSFSLFKNIKVKNLDDIETAFKESKFILSQLPRNNLDTYVLTDDNINIIHEITERMLKFYADKEILFDPKFDGCGIMSNCKGDVYFNKTLAEIKAGDRNFQIQDLRQLLTYASLNWLANSYIIQNIQLFNPRTGKMWISSITDFVSSITDLSFEDLFQQIGNYLIDLSDDITLAIQNR